MHNHNENSNPKPVNTICFEIPYETNGFVCFKTNRNVSHCNYGWDLPLHKGSQVMSLEYDMDAYTATIFGGETWDVLRVGLSKKLYPTLDMILKNFSS